LYSKRARALCERTWSLTFCDIHYRAIVAADALAASIHAAVVAAIDAAIDATGRSGRGGVEGGV